MMNQKRINQQFEFIKEIDKEKSIKRQTYHTDGKTLENDAEHAWHIAIMTLLLSEYANEKIDVLKTISMLLIHDLVEIKAGDTYAYDEKAKLNQREKELEAADIVFSMLPKDQGKKLRDLWDEFEEGDSPEAKFARTMDKIQPIIQNGATNGKMWKQKGIRLSQILERNKDTDKGSKELWQYVYENYITPSVENGKIINE